MGGLKSGMMEIRDSPNHHCNCALVLRHCATDSPGTITELGIENVNHERLTDDVGRNPDDASRRR